MKCQLTLDGQLCAHARDVQLHSSTPFGMIASAQAGNALLAPLMDVHVTCWSGAHIGSIYVIPWSDGPHHDMGIFVFFFWFGILFIFNRNQNREISKYLNLVEEYEEYMLRVSLNVLRIERERSICANLHRISIEAALLYTFKCYA